MNILENLVIAYKIDLENVVEKSKEIYPILTKKDFKDICNTNVYDRDSYFSFGLKQGDDFYMMVMTCSELRTQIKIIKKPIKSYKHLGILERQISPPNEAYEYSGASPNPDKVKREMDKYKNKDIFKGCNHS